MFTAKTILIVEENAYSALDLATAVEGHHGIVAGPVATTREALAIVSSGSLTAAIVDADVAGVAMLVERLEQTDVPHVLQSASRLTPRVGRQAATMLYRPIDPAMVMSMLSIAIGKAEQKTA